MLVHPNTQIALPLQLKQPMIPERILEASKSQTGIIIVKALFKEIRIYV
jgi:hypothetical protein